MNRKVITILVLSSILGLLFDLLFYGKAPGISIFLYALAGLVAMYILILEFRAKLNQSLVYIVPLILFFSAMTFIRASAFLTFLNVVFLLYLTFLTVRLLMRPDVRLSHYQPKQYLSDQIRLPFESLGEASVFGRWLAANRKHKHKAKQSNVTPVIRGILLSLPFLIVFLLLFASADLVFKEFVSSLFDFVDFDIPLPGELIFRSILIGLVTAATVGTYALIFMRPRPGQPHASQAGAYGTAGSDSKVLALGSGVPGPQWPDTSPKTSDAQAAKYRLGATEATIMLGSVGALFLLFVLVQITYFFGGRTNIVGIADAGFTYAEYARRGFFELLLVAIISWALIWAVHKSTFHKNRQQKVVFRWLNGLLVLEVFIIMLSAVRRLGLYESAYGFTTLRLYSHLFIGWLAVAFVLILVHIFREQKDRQFAFQFFISIVGFMLLLNVINPDATIARQNIKRFEQTGKLDTRYITRLSADAMPEIIPLLHVSDQAVQKAVAHRLYNKKVSSDSQSLSWQSYNVARSRSNQLLNENAAQLEANKDYVPARDYR